MEWIKNLRPSGGLAARAEARQPGDWYRIRNITDDEAELLLYDEIGGWFGTYADDLVAELKGITAPRITVRINSPGGSVFEGIAIANALRAHPATVTTRVDGIAASIASVIAMAGDRLVMMPNTQLMIHDASGLCIGNGQDMQAMADLLDLQSDNIADVYAQRAGGSREDWRKRMTAETWYLAQEAVDAGLADEVAELPRKDQEPAEPEEPEMRRRWDLSAYQYAGRENAPPPTPAAQEKLTIDIGSAVGEELAAAIRDMVRSEAVRHAEDPETDSDPPPDPPPPPEPQAAATEPDTTTVPGSTHEEPETAPDSWAAMVTHLTDPANEWSSLVAHLTDTPSSAATDA